jgi:hypothetical protein
MSVYDVPPQQKREMSDEVLKDRHRAAVLVWVIGCGTVMVCTFFVCICITSASGTLAVNGGGARPKREPVEWPTSYSWLGSDEEYVFYDYHKVKVRVRITKEPD